MLGATALIVGVGAVGTAITLRLVPFSDRSDPGRADERFDVGVVVVGAVAGAGGAAVDGLADDPPATSSLGRLPGLSTS